MVTSAAERPVIALRADGGRAVGLGHVRRSLALAAALAPWADCHLLLHADDELIGSVRRGGRPCLPVGADMEDSLAAVRPIRAAALVVDSYAVSAQELERALDSVRLLVVVDDTGRFPLPAHLVVNSAFGLVQPNQEDGTLYLLGPRFALLAREFAEHPVKPSHRNVRRILLTLGGATPALLMGVLARAARQALPEAALEIVVGPFGDDSAAVMAALGGIGGCTLHAAPGSIRPLMLAADVAVTAGGVTLSELAATATPAVGICLAPNQQANLAGFAQEGAMVLAGRADDPGLPAAVEAAIAALAQDSARRRGLGERARRLVDGHGAVRVADTMREWFSGTHVALANGSC